MRIYIISRGVPTAKDPQWGCFEMDQAMALKSVGHDVVILCVDGRLRLANLHFGATEQDVNGIPVFNFFVAPRKVLQLFGHKWAKNYLQNKLDKLYRIAEKKYGRPDVVYAHYLPNMERALVLKQRHGLPVVGIEHWSRIFSTNIPRLIKSQAQQTYPQLDRLITVSEALQKSISQQFGADSIVVPNVVGSEFDFKAKLLSTKKFSIVSVGTLLPLKRFDLAIEAFSRLASTVDCEYTIVGGGPMAQNLKQQIHSLGLDDKVHLVGRKTKDEIAELLKNNHIFLLSSDTETFGVVCIEAMACGLPVVATRCGGPENIITDENGLLCPKNDADAMAEALNNIITNYSHYDRQQIADKCRQNYGPEAIGRKLTEIFQSLSPEH